MTKYDKDLKKLKELVLTLNEDEIKKVSDFLKKLEMEKKK